jgi:hypothetical protein
MGINERGSESLDSALAPIAVGKGDGDFAHNTPQYKYHEVMLKHGVINQCLTSQREMYLR